MSLSLRRAAVAVTVAALAALGATALPAAATPAAVTYNSVLVPTSPGHLVFRPATASGPRVPTAQNRCGPHTPQTFRVLNRSRVAQQFTLDGGDVGPLIAGATAHTEFYLIGCIRRAGTYAVGVRGHPFAHLRLTVR